MTIITINEENHCLIGVADRYQSAVTYLINNAWLEDLTMIYEENGEDWHYLLGILGADWSNQLLTWDIARFNNFFKGSFTLREVEVFCA